MSIKNRLKNLESKMNAGSCETCQCPGTSKFDTILHENGKPSDEPLEPLPVCCGTCGKPVDRKIIIINLIDSASEVQL